jgi:hypothetical protein
MPTLYLATTAEPDPQTQIPSTLSAPLDAVTPTISAAAPPPITEPAGLLTRAAKGKARAQAVEAPPVTVINPDAGPPSAPYRLRNRKGRALIVDSSSEGISDSCNDGTLEKVAEMPGGMSVPRVQVEAASPPKTKLPFATGNVRFDFPSYYLLVLIL